MFKEYNDYVELLSTKSKHTIKAYTGSIEKYFAGLNISSLEDMTSVTSIEAQKYFQSLITNGMKKNSVNGHITRVKAFHNWCVQNRLMTENNIEGVKHYKVEKNIKFIPEKEEIITLIESYNKPQYKIMFQLMMVSGLRREEVTNIRLKDIENCHILINGKGGKQRKVLLGDKICEDLGEYLDYVVEKFPDVYNPYLFFSKRGQGENLPIQPNTISQRFEKVISYGLEKGILSPERAEKFTPHAIRRFFATYLIEEGVDILNVQGMMGHEDMRTTLIYAKSTQRGMDNAMRKVSFE